MSCLVCLVIYAWVREYNAEDRGRECLPMSMAMCVGVG